jgi:hypothetical protein
MAGSGVPTISETAESVILKVGGVDPCKKKATAAATTACATQQGQAYGRCMDANFRASIIRLCWPAIVNESTARAKSLCATASAPGCNEPKLLAILDAIDPSGAMHKTAAQLAAEKQPAADVQAAVTSSPPLDEMLTFGPQPAPAPARSGPLGYPLWAWGLGAAGVVGLWYVVARK